jgi:alpha-glucosidase
MWNALRRSPGVSPASSCTVPVQDQLRYNITASPILMRYLILTLLFVSTSAFAESEPVVLTSPNGDLAIRFQTIDKSSNAAPAGQLVYDVSFRGKSMLNPSALNLTLAGEKPLGANVRMTNAMSMQSAETYWLVAGRAHQVGTNYASVSVDIEEADAPNRKMTIEARAYNDAIAFRYVVPEQPALKEFRLAKENTEFRVSMDAMCYALILPNFQSQYENDYVKLPVSALSPIGLAPKPEVIGLPLLMQFPGIGWMAITEADVRDYSSLYLQNPAADWSMPHLEARLAPHTNDETICVTGSLPHHSAWRVLQIGDEPVKFIESSVISSLSPPPDPKFDTRWIRPGKCAWDWWGGSIGPDGVSAFNDATMKHYVDFAAKSGLEYMLVDAGWSPQNDITKMNGTVDIPALVQYAAKKKVRIWIWAHWTAVNGHEEEAFSLFQKWGVAGVKIDFMSSDDQGMLGFYYRVAETAAKHRLMIDFHGATKPTGLERTFPNVLGYEGVLGMEWNKATARDNPDHHLMLPFTRMIAGMMDYTPGGFNNVTPAEFKPRSIKPMVQCTRAQQLAMYVVYESPFQMVSDYPGAYKGQPEFQFIKDVPASWDETRGLNGVPGEFITVARRNGHEWFLGSMCNSTGRELKVPLDFLDLWNYRAEIYADAPDAGENPKHVDISTKTVTRESVLDLKLAPGGGCAVRLVPLPPKIGR